MKVEIDLNDELILAISKHIKLNDVNKGIQKIIDK